MGNFRILIEDPEMEEETEGLLSSYFKCVLPSALGPGMNWLFKLCKEASKQCGIAGYNLAQIYALCGWLYSKDTHMQM